MDNLLLYLLKTSAGTTLLYLCFLLFFRKDTFFLRNRVFLIITLLLPAIFPLIRIPVTSSIIATPMPVGDPGSAVLPGSAGVTAIARSANTSTVDYNRILLWTYFTVTCFLLLRIGVSLLSTYKIIRKGTLKTDRFPKIIVSDYQSSPFSFYPYAVIPSKDYKNDNYSEILDHEFAHLHQGHTFDLLLCELFIAFQWFNPFIWLIKRSIILNHEYLADHISIGTNKSIKEYQYKLLKVNSQLRNISLAHNFNSQIKNRIIMINRKPSLRLATLKNIIILPVLVSVAYAFATPEYHYTSSDPNPLSISQAYPVQQKIVRGIVTDDNGKPLSSVHIFVTGTIGNAKMATTGDDGRFSIENVRDDAKIMFSKAGYKEVSLKPDFRKEMTIKMAIDPEYKKTEEVSANDTVPEKLVVWDNKVTDQSTGEIFASKSMDIGTVKELKGKEATDKYGEAGKNGVVEFYSVEKAEELKLIPYRRRTPEDFPTFQGQPYTAFNDWVTKNTNYPAKATDHGVSGRITATYRVEEDGSVDHVTLMGQEDTLLGNAVIKAIESSPKWEPAKNPKANGPFANTVYVKFELPDKVEPDDVYVMCEQMPNYPGGDAALLKFIAENTNYPDSAMAHRIQGRVIVRFVIDKEGKAIEPVILKGVDPLLDAEALRVVNMFGRFSPGLQDGKPVPVYYMVPITFGLPKSEPSDTIKKQR